MPVVGAVMYAATDAANAVVHLLVKQVFFMIQGSLCDFYQCFDMGQGRGDQLADRVLVDFFKGIVGIVGTLQDDQR